MTEKYKSQYPTLRQAKTHWSNPSIIQKQGEGPSHQWLDMLKKDAKAKLAASAVQSKLGKVHNGIWKEAKDRIGKPTPSAEEIAKKHNLSVDQINAQIKKGIEVEKEHTPNEAEAHEIARDHLDEFPDYYDRLGAMEKAAKKEMKKEGYDPDVEQTRNRIEAHKKVAEKMAQAHGEHSQEAAFHRAYVRHMQKQLKDQYGIEEEVANSVGGGNIAGMPTHSTPDQTPVRKSKVLRRDRFAGKTVFEVDEDTYYKAYLGKRKYEHYEKFLEGCEGYEEIRDYGRKYWDEPILLRNEKTGAMQYLKYGSK